MYAYKCGYVQVFNRWRCEHVPADTERHPGGSEDPHVTREHVIGVNSQRREVAHSVELPRHLDGRPLGPRLRARGPRERLVPPADPLVPFHAQTARVQPEVRLTLLAVGQLTQPARQPSCDVTSCRLDGDVTVVYGIVEVEFGVAAVALRHRVPHRAVCNRQRLSNFNLTPRAKIITLNKQMNSCATGVESIQ